MSSLNFGSDKPDTRYGLEIADISDYVRDLARGANKVIECLVIQNGAALSGSEIKSLEALSKDDASGSAVNTIKINERNVNTWILNSTILKRSPNALAAQDTITRSLNVNIGSLVVVTTRDEIISGVWTLMGRIRAQAASVLLAKGLLEVPSQQNSFLWIESFPLFTQDPETGNLLSTHHPFTAPIPEDIDLLATHPEKVRAQHYDLVLNGVEIGGGSIRIHSPLLQAFVLNNILKIREEERQGFKHLIDALGQGCPPHGGIALGFDRLVAMLCGMQSVRDVMAFPKAASGSDLAVSSPSAVAEERMKEYGIQLVPEATRD